MSSELNKKQNDNAQARELKGQGLRIGIVAARWNSTITDPMLDSAVATLRRHGCHDDDILVERVPGTVELTYGAALMARHFLTDAVIVIVSEETGSISVAIEGMLKRHLSPATLNKLLRAELIPETKTERKFQLIPWIKEKILRVKSFLPGSW